MRRGVNPLVVVPAVTRSESEHRAAANTRQRDHRALIILAFYV
jgi:hypothetical protein